VSMMMVCICVDAFNDGPEVTLMTVQVHARGHGTIVL